MRILWLDHACRHDRYDDWLHWKFAKAIKNYADIFFYAPCIKAMEPNFTPIEYEPNKMLEDIVSQLKIDAVIVDTRSASYDNYFPQLVYPESPVGHCWFPPDFADCKVLKLCIEEDFQYETDDVWHQQMGFKAILHKHYSQAIRKMVLPFIFFPFSVDIDVFKPTNIMHREPRIGCAGTMYSFNSTSKQSVYLPREKAAEILGFHNLLATTTYVKAPVIGDGYIDYLQKYMGYLSCGSIYDLTNAKMFEIMASGGVLLTNKTPGLDILFGNDTYVTYEDDARDVAGKAQRIINDEEFRGDILRRSMDCILRKHTHKVRIQELLKIIKDFL
jgi:hypothetical protein